MIIVGSGNLGKLILEQIVAEKSLFSEQNILFFDEKTSEDLIFGKYKILKSNEQIKEYCYLTGDLSYFVAIGNPRIRMKYDSFFKELGCLPEDIIMNLSIKSENSIYEKHLYLGYLSGIYHSCSIGYSNIIHAYCRLGHGIQTGSFVNISSGTSILANTSIGDFTFIGANALIMPNVKIGKNCYVNAGSIIKSDMKEYETR